MPGGNGTAPKLSSRQEAALTTWLKAKNKSGLDVPWVYLRRAVASAWCVPPWVVDEAPIDEVLMELKIMSIEGEAAA